MIGSHCLNTVSHLFSELFPLNKQQCHICWMSFFPLIENSFASVERVVPTDQTTVSHLLNNMSWNNIHMPIHIFFHYFSCFMIIYQLITLMVIQLLLHCKCPRFTAEVITLTTDCLCLSLASRVVTYKLFYPLSMITLTTTTKTTTQSPH